jgi:hypothetical protein
MTPVRSYRTISPLPAPSSRAARRLCGVFLWHWPAGFPGSDFPTTLPYGVRTFLEGPVVSPASPRPLGWPGRWYARMPTLTTAGRKDARTVRRWPLVVERKAGRSSAELRTAQRAAATSLAHDHAGAAYRAVGHSVGTQALPCTLEALFQGQPAAAGADALSGGEEVERAFKQRGGHLIPFCTRRPRGRGSARPGCESAPSCCSRAASARDRSP